MRNIPNTMSIKGLEAIARQVDQLEENLEDDDVVTADDKMAIVKQIEMLRKKLRKNADDLEYDNTQLLADKLREVTHIISDLISARAVKGGDTKLLQKLASQIINVTKSLSFGGDDDSNDDGFKDDADLSFIEKPESSKDEFHDAVKRALKQKGDAPDSKKEAVDNKKPSDKESSKDKKPEEKPKKESPKKIEEDDEAEDDSKNNDKKPKDDKKSKKSGGFMDSLDDAEASASVVTSSLRFTYFGIKKVKKNGEHIRVIKAMYGDNTKDVATSYYYLPTKTLLGGDVDRVHAAFEKILKDKKGYHALASFLNKLAASGKLKIVKKKAIDVTTEIHTEDPERSWSFIGVQEHPLKSGKKAIWFEIGDKQFAAVPSKRFEGGDANEAASWIKINVLGNKDAAGTSYLKGLKTIENMVHSGKLKIIFHAAV